MDFFSVSGGLIITRDARDIILEGGRKIAVVPAWEWAGNIGEWKAARAADIPLP
jgi:hypothetical protein